MLKQNVTDLTDASDILAQLQPKRYQFTTADYPSWVYRKAPTMASWLAIFRPFCPIWSER
ncbi:MAG: tail fiber domain-containing protein [Flavobacteriales bacterium]|nr:tail fiber domain-containing protein [Flavobacteriales bacterium]